MKRKLHHFILLTATVVLTVCMPSCRSSKKNKSEFYQSQIENLRRGKHKSDKNDKQLKGISGTRNRIVEEAMTWKGTPYCYGRADKGKACDCSGMVMCVYEKVTGIKLPRNSAKQQEYCRNLKKKDVLIGDLCFFATGKDPDRTSHVGIMVDDRNFIHASSSKGVVVSDITQPYWIKTFKGYGRVFMNE